MDSNIGKELDSNSYSDTNRKLPIVFIVSLFLMLLPLIVISMVYTTVIWEIDISQGLVFTATVGVLTRVFLRTGVRVGIRTGIRSGIRTGVRSIIRGGVREVISNDRLEPRRSNWFTRWIFVSPVDYKKQSQGFLGEFTRMLLTVIILAISLFLVATFKSSEEFTQTPYEMESRLMLDLLAILLVVLILYFVEKIFTEWILKRDYCFYLTPDGILVQALFTFGLSFLPLVHDSEMQSRGEEPEIKPRAYMGLVGIGSLIITALIAHFVLLESTGDPFFSSLADIAILFALLFSFPSQPYEGGDIFAWNKLISLLVFTISMGLSIFILSVDLANLI